jgi:hypothetical protein
LKIVLVGHLYPRQALRIDGVTLADDMLQGRDAMEPAVAGKRSSCSKRLRRTSPG